jgi:pimeloyl-ACP methyl ester carboxylesterase
MPVLTIHGTKDRNAPYGSGREWAFNLPNARLLTIKGGAHNA